MKGSTMVYGLLAAALVACGCGGDSGTNSSSPAGTISPTKALEVGRRSGSVPIRIGLESHPASQLRTEGAWYVMPGTNTKIAREPRQGMAFDLQGAHRSFGTGSATPIDLATSAATAIPVADNRGLFFANTYPSTDTVITPGVSGIEMDLQLRGPSAPSSFSWKVLGSETQLVGQPKSEFAGLHYRFRTPRVSGSGFALSIDVLPYPHDSAGYPYKPGTRLSTQLTASGHRVTVQIDHSADHLVYPLVVPITWRGPLLP